MKAFDVCSSRAAVIDRNDIDTDVIVRIERIAQLKRGQFAPWAFEVWRYRADGTENPDFVLNQPLFRAAQILVAGRNFGCGSSREMAVWALDEFGIRCVIAPSFGDIFFNNCLQIGVLPVRLAAEAIEPIAAAARQGVTVTVDLRDCTVRLPDGSAVGFTLAESQRTALLNGLDDVDMAVARESRIAAFQAADRQRRPWAYPR
ncbi:MULTISPECIES: 3-isopropylmalate dehydratase small subunit [unclassified Achromobacter]|uniref:3-isopropylmalate dehydratase small subunit n=1 Tax=unclassified Achromobacter TaxID=2626865 RepID=UPI000B515FCA|nr:MULTISPECIES: 3-isopropylmalate dehydratase small subunit [unclassified Achromobacter]OWT80735.1 3-isopropylmalate dehydratase small subunit [Achromobacter sp. HZ34]OWT81251.1 3-isopropylmalate dehydratase small subunit [Achromobacter sp. HZ28]